MDCPTEIPEPVRAAMTKLATAWATSEARPCVHPSTANHWSRLLQAWASDPTLPLLVRKRQLSSPYGHALTHAEGRSVVLVDNSPALWACEQAFLGKRPSLKEIRETLLNDRLPIAMVIPKPNVGKDCYRCDLGAVMTVNQRGWKLAHIEPVGLRKRGLVERMPLDLLRDRFVRLMDPSNMFVVPKAWAGLGELPEMISAIRRSAA